MLYSAVQCSAVYCSVLQCSELNWSEVLSTDITITLCTPSSLLPLLNLYLCEFSSTFIPPCFYLLPTFYFHFHFTHTGILYSIPWIYCTKTERNYENFNGAVENLQCVRTAPLKQSEGSRRISPGQTWGYKSEVAPASKLPLEKRFYTLPSNSSWSFWILKTSN